MPGGQTVRQAVRQAGVGDLSSIAVVVLESNGGLSVITSDGWGDGSALDDVRIEGGAT